MAALDVVITFACDFLSVICINILDYFLRSQCVMPRIAPVGRFAPISIRLEVTDGQKNACKATLHAFRVDLIKWKSNLLEKVDRFIHARFGHFPADSAVTLSHG